MKSNRLKAEAGSLTVAARGEPGGSMTRRERLTILARGAATMLIAMGLGRFAFTALLPAMQVGTGFSDADAGWMASLNLAGYLGGVFWAGRAGPATKAALFRAGLIVAVVGVAAMALDLGLVYWDVLRFVAGVTSGLLFVLGTSFVFDRGAASGPSGAALHFAGVGVGIALSGIVGQLIGDWRVAWIVLGVVALVLAVVGHGLPAPTPGRAAPGASPPASVAIRWTPGFTLLVVAYALEGLGYIVAGTFLVSILRRAPETAHLASFAWILAGLTAIPSPLVWGRIAHRIGYWGALTLAYGVQAIGIFLAVAGSPTAALISAASFGFTFVAAAGMSVALGSRLQPGAVGPATALITIGYGVGQIVGPWAAGLAAASTDGFTVPLIGAGAVVVASALLSAVGHVVARRVPLA